MFNDPITKTYDEIDVEPDDLIFAASSVDDIASLHPPPVRIFRLWQTFLDNVNPLLKLFHAPTVQQQILDASADLSKISKSMHVLMFGIYAMAISSLNYDECNAIFGEERKPLLKRYQNGCRQALIRASFLRTSDMTILQGYVLYLHSAANFTVDPRALYCLTGIAVRLGQRMGLNFDGTLCAMPPFETEMRRRLWWQIVFLDTRIGELSGSATSMFQHIRSVHLPLNVNDADLFPDMREPPVEHPGATEMLFVLPRCEVIKFLLKNQSRHPPVGPGILEIPQKEMQEFEDYVTEKYRKCSDPQIPLHKSSILNTRYHILRAKLRGRPPSSYVRNPNTSEAEKEKVFTLSLEMVETFHLMITSPNIERFHWMVFKNFPFPAHVHLLVALRTRTTGPLSDRAWDALIEHGRIRRSLSWGKWRAEDRSTSTVQLAMANLTIKAWEAREAARLPYVEKRPSLIGDLMEVLQRGRDERGSTTGSSPGSMALEVMGAGPQSTEGFWGSGWQGDQNMGMGMGFTFGNGSGMGGINGILGNDGFGDMGMGMGMGMGMDMMGVAGGRVNENANWAIWGDFTTGFEGTGGVGTKQFSSRENDWQVGT
ncbi:hypothetical protein HYALB_00001699 [Hymenoscyphus albidus]|uniref:Xylanolytic transcriptional activator regulatory domain-containing protein n=1 Tax=Hymenoscyphus albidus TaxID=595503 RepID=A0A9N9PRD3_9HELO|nr:hypothetical protein HYALB_00001699 [Hymenoscyphus albidus]